MDTKYEWILKETVWARQFAPPTPGNVLVYDDKGEHAVIMSWNLKTSQIYFNGEYCDIGDDMTEYLAVMDDAVEHYPSTVVSLPHPHDHLHGTSCQCRGPGRGCLREPKEHSPDCNCAGPGLGCFEQNKEM
jgi:hypothetical protein